MQLVQLSDIHVETFFKQQVFDAVAEEVNKQNPDAIIVQVILLMRVCYINLNMLVHKLRNLLVLT